MTQRYSKGLHKQCQGWHQYTLERLREQDAEKSFTPKVLLKNYQRMGLETWIAEIGESDHLIEQTDIVQANGFVL